MSESKYEPPAREAKDEVHLAIRAALAGMPTGGGAAAELFARVVTPPLQNRLHGWREAVGRRLAELDQQDVLDVEALVDDPAFLSAAMEASQAALKTHHEEKLSALRNALINVALREEPDESMQSSLIQLVDRLTPWHLRILRLFQGPEQWFRQQDRQVPRFHMTSAFATVLKKAYPELEEQRDLYDRIVNDLNSEGLLSADGNGFHVSLSATGGLAKLTTSFGDRLVTFISRPDGETD